MRLTLFLPFACLAVLPVHAQEIVDPRSGRLFLTVTDLVLQAGAINLELSRTLETERRDRGLLGTRWRLNWESRLVRATPHLLVVETPQMVTFSPARDKPGYVSASGGRLVFGKNGRGIRTRSDGSRETFDAQGRLVERDERNGNKIILRYGADRRLTRVEGPAKSFLQFISDNQGRLVRVETSTGATVRYAYLNDDLAEVQVNGGPPVRYAYDTAGNLIRIDEPRTGAVALTYDAKGRVLSRRWANGSQDRYEYDDATRRQRYIDPVGGITTTQWSQDRRQVEITDPLGHKSAMVYDEAGRLVSVTGATGATARITYDAVGRLVAAENAAGQAIRFDYLEQTSRVKAITRPDGARQLFDYDRRGNLTTVKLGTETILALTYHPDGSLATAKGRGLPEQRLTYHPHGRLKSITNALGATTAFEYDLRGNLIREANPLGGVIHYQYDAQNRLLSVTDAVGGVTRYGYDPQSRLSRITDPSDGVTLYEYDVRGQLLAQTDPAGRTTRYEYDAAGRLLGVSEPDSASQHWRYDAARSLKEWTNPMGRTTRFDHDPLGRVTEERWATGLGVRYRYDALGNLVGLEDATGAKSEFQRDAIGRLTATVDPLGAVRRYLYDPLGNLLTLTGPSGQVKSFTYTHDGLLAAVQEPSGDAAGYEYDAAGRLVAIHRPSGGMTRFTYDAMGNLLSETDPLGNQRRHAYDLAGRRISTTDALTRVSHYVYDQAGRLTQEQLADGKRVTYQYDRLGNLLQADDGLFPIRFSYDPAGRLVRVEYSAINKAVSYEYDASGLRTKLIGPDGSQVHYEYNAQKRPAVIVLPDGQRIGLGYDVQERLQEVRYPNGITGRWEYDAVGQVARIAYREQTGKIVAGWTYRYDPGGNLVEWQDHQQRTTRVQYDAAGQLTEEATPGGTMRYRYLAGGHRHTLEAGGAVIQYHHDAADRLLQAGQEQLTYDANGHLMQRQGPSGTTVYEYDAGGRLVKVVGPDGATTTFGYAPTGERIWKKDKEGLTYYLYDGFNLIQELAENGTPKVVYVHGPGIDRPLAMLRDGRSYYYHADRLGSVGLLTDDRGQVAAAYDHDAFGKLRAQQGSVPNPFIFTGREWDASTGLYYYRARYYDPVLGRFLSRDPIQTDLEEALDQNPYLYVRNNPLSYVDPLGLSGIDARTKGYMDWLVEDAVKHGRPVPTLREQLQAAQEYFRAVMKWPGHQAAKEALESLVRIRPILDELNARHAAQVAARRINLLPGKGKIKVVVLVGVGAAALASPGTAEAASPSSGAEATPLVQTATQLAGDLVTDLAVDAICFFVGNCIVPGGGAVLVGARDLADVGDMIVRTLPLDQLQPPPFFLPLNPEDPTGIGIFLPAPTPENIEMARRLGGAFGTGVPPDAGGESGDTGGLLHPGTGLPIGRPQGYDWRRDPGMPTGTPEQIGQAGQQTGPFAGGIPPRGQPETGGVRKPETQQPSTYTETPGQTGGEKPQPPPAGIWCYSERASKYYFIPSRYGPCPPPSWDPPVGATTSWDPPAGTPTWQGQVERVPPKGQKDPKGKPATPSGGKPMGPKPSCGPGTSCRCAGGGIGHIPCDKSKGSCHCGAG